jgi:FKBP-type peptidyl-prolyl cis-trans isomerase SlyD
MEIANDRVVSIDYRLTDDEGKELDASAPEQPLVYLHGHKNIIPGLEQALEGKTTGESLDVRVAPAEAYGERMDQLQQVVSKSQFEGVEGLEGGLRLQASTPQGPIPIEVVKIEGEEVTIDANHPLAGKHLNFAVTVKDVRESSEEERGHGHVHGSGGHEH